ncbi:DUF502 domain-containing protein [Fodinicurvata halophila]|uniref:DUF502 domain-containing protein n=1 Tax=Fodinicurvata halophila TaxID=1419723 RepID=UPI003633DF96
MFTAGLIGRALMDSGERLLARVPIVRSIYGSLKQVFETVLAQNSRAFRDVVLVEYPYQGVWAIGFVTSETRGEVQRVTENEVVSVFVPATPNPTTGFLLFLPREEVHQLDMTVEQGLKLVISGESSCHRAASRGPCRKCSGSRSRRRNGDWDLQLACGTIS